MTETPLDRAAAAMAATPGEDAARLAFYDRLAAAELFLLLAAEPEGDSVTPELFEVEGTRYALAFDTEDRLSGFTGRPAPYAALSGRTLADLAAAEGLGLGLNLGAASETLLPPEALAWLAETLAAAPAETEARPLRIAPPAGLPETLVTALDARLAATAGWPPAPGSPPSPTRAAATGHLLAFEGTLPGAEPALARTAGEALTFSGIEAGALDIAFFAAGDPILAALDRHGLRFDLPAPDAAGLAPTAPGTDPDRPPRLR
jgi:hypothetical protein